MKKNKITSSQIMELIESLKKAGELSNTVFEFSNKNLKHEIPLIYQLEKINSYYKTSHLREALELLERLYKKQFIAENGIDF